MNIKRTIIEKHVKKYFTLINVNGPKLRKYAITGLISVAPKSIKNKVNNASNILRKRIIMIATKSVELY